MRNLLPLLLLLPACQDPIDENLAGKLVRVEVTSSLDECRPARFTGDAGVQFFGVRPDGGVVFTISQQAQFGPMVDGGVLESVQRQILPTPGNGRTNVASGDACVGTFSAWVQLDGGLENAQEWPGIKDCPAGPIWLPVEPCRSTRSFSMTELGDCQLRCVIISAAGEISCDC